MGHKSRQGFLSMIDKSNLIICLERLELELRKSGKIDTADFFAKQSFVISQAMSADELRDVLDQLRGSGAMAQYANFSYREDQLFDDCYKEAKRLLELI